MASTDLVGDDHRVADTAVFPEVHIRSSIAHFSLVSLQPFNNAYNTTYPQILVAFTCTNTCPGRGLALGFLDEVDLVRGVVERGDVRLWTGYLAVLEDAKLGGVEYLARVVHGCVWLGDLGRHGGR
jgi:hypothetical protein